MSRGTLGSASVWARTSAQYRSGSAGAPCRVHPRNSGPTRARTGDSRARAYRCRQHTPRTQHGDGPPSRGSCRHSPNTAGGGQCPNVGDKIRHAVANGTPGDLDELGLSRLTGAPPSAEGGGLKPEHRGGFLLRHQTVPTRGQEVTGRRRFGRRCSRGVSGRGHGGLQQEQAAGAMCAPAVRSGSPSSRCSRALGAGGPSASAFHRAVWRASTCRRLPTPMHLACAPPGVGIPAHPLALGRAGGRFERPPALSNHQLTPSGVRARQPQVVNNVLLMNVDGLWKVSSVQVRPHCTRTRGPPDGPSPTIEQPFFCHLIPACLSACRGVSDTPLSPLTAAPLLASHYCPAPSASASSPRRWEQG